jgi:hypothetical protein
MPEATVAAEAAGLPISGHTEVKCNFERSKLSAEEAASKILNEWSAYWALIIQMNTYIETKNGGLG